MSTMTKKFMTFKHWKTGKVKTSEFRDADEPANPSSERLVVRNKTEQKLEDVIKPPSSGYANNELNASCSV